jgi:RNA polymerase subunit RPABC4/transcription elongation factor Spt4
MVMIACPQCGQRMLDVASSCPKCGHVLMQNPLEAGAAAKLRACERCGKHIERDAIVCPFCGWHVQRARTVRRVAWTVGPVLVVVAGVALLLQRGVLQLPRWTFPHRAPPIAATPADAPPPAPVTARPLVVDAQAPAPSPAATLPAPAAAPPPSPRVATAELQVRWTTEWANVRAERTVASAVIRVLSPGARVAIGDPSGGWWAVYIDGAPVGFIANSLLGPSPP